MRRDIIVKVIIALLVPFAISVFFQFFYFGGFTSSDLKSMNLNIIIGIITIAVTVFIVDKLIKKHQKRKFIEQYFSLLGKRHETYVNELKKTFINLVTKSPKHENLNNVLNNLDHYIDENFLSNRMEVISFNKNDVFKPNIKKINVLKGITIFKKKVENLNTKHLSRYIQIIPEDVLQHIFKIDDLLNRNMLSSPYDFGVEYLGDIAEKNCEFDPNEYVKVFREIGEEILALEHYYEQYNSEIDVIY